MGSRYRYQLQDGFRVPDPASRFQPDDVQGPSVVVDPAAYAWRHVAWRGRPWEEAVLYELHVGAFSAEGTFDGLRRRLDYLADLGVTAIELMPLSDFAGTRNWGYDGVMPFAPDAAYGSPDDLKRLIDEAHGRGLMMFLDVVYNHFGPWELPAPVRRDFFEPEEHTPWGAAINYKVRAVRDFAIHNVLYWLEEFRFDGLRFDAVDRIIDRGEEHILKEIAATVRRTIPPSGTSIWCSRTTRTRRTCSSATLAAAGLLRCAVERRHPPRLSPPADRRGGRLLRRLRHGAHERLGRALSSGFVYQGDVSEYRDGEVRGEPSGICRRPRSSRSSRTTIRSATARSASASRISPRAKRSRRCRRFSCSRPDSAPVHGREWGATQPFCFFTDFHDELADAVREGRRREFQKFPEFASEAARAHIPDPNALSTFAASRLDWSVPEQPEHRAWLDSCAGCIRIRHEMIAPRLGGVRGHAGKATVLSDSALRVAWTLADGSTLELIANLADRASPVTLADEVAGDVLFANHPDLPAELRAGRLPPWSVLWLLHPRVMSAREPIRRLGELYGIDSSYTDFFGKRRQVPLATERALLQAMGVAVGSAREIADSLREAEARPWRRMLAPVRVIAAPEPPEVTFTLPARLGGATIDWTLAEETGGVHEGRLTPDELPEVAAAEVDGTAYRRWRMALPSDLPHGYHRLSMAVRGAAHARGSLQLIVAQPVATGPHLSPGSGA